MLNNTSLTLQQTHNETVERLTFESLHVLPATVIAILAVIANGTALLVFIKDRSLRTPFHVFIIHLFLVNLAQTLFRGPLDVVANLYSDGKWILGDRVCIFYLFLQSFGSAAIVNTHGLIGFNRAWAILHPLSYRTRNSIRLSVRLFVGLWVYLALFNGTLWALDTFAYRLPVKEPVCVMNIKPIPALQLYNLVALFISYVLPILVTLISFPVVTISELARLAKRRKIAAVKNATCSEVNQTADTRIDGGPSEPAEPLPVKRVVKVVRPKQRRYLVLTLMTTSITVSYVPLTVYFLISSFKPNFWSPVFWRLSNLLVYTQPVLDVVFLVASMERLRAGVLRLFKRRSN